MVIESSNFENTRNRHARHKLERLHHRFVRRASVAISLRLVVALTGSLVREVLRFFGGGGVYTLTTPRGGSLDNTLHGGVSALPAPLAQPYDGAGLMRFLDPCGCRV